MGMVRQCDGASDDRVPEEVRSEGRFPVAKTATYAWPRLRREHPTHACPRLPAGDRTDATSAAGSIPGAKGRDSRGRRVPRREQILHRLIEGQMLLRLPLLTPR